jgi:hypothetical protein
MVGGWRNAADLVGGVSLDDKDNVLASGAAGPLTVRGDEREHGGRRKGAQRSSIRSAMCARRGFSRRALWF